MGRKETLDAYVEKATAKINSELTEKIDKTMSAANVTLSAKLGTSVQSLYKITTEMLETLDKTNKEVMKGAMSLLDDAMEEAIQETRAEAKEVMEAEIVKYGEQMKHAIDILEQKGMAWCRGWADAQLAGVKVELYSVKGKLLAVEGELLATKKEVLESRLEMSSLKEKVHAKLKEIVDWMNPKARVGHASAATPK